MCDKYSDDQQMQTAEIKKLQEALAWSLEENQRLKKENELLSRQAKTELALQRKDYHGIEQEVKLLKLQDRKLKQQVQIADLRLQRMQQQYDALANSKLGRLTLNYWAWRKQNPNQGLLGKTIGFISNWLFNRLPDVKTIDLTKEEYQVLPEVGSTKQTSAAVPVIASPSENKSADMPVNQFQMTAEQENWIDNYMERIAAIPDSNGCRYYEKLPYRIGLICDEFFYESISAAADFVFLTPDNWRDEVEKGLDALLFVTAWRGLNEEWRGLGAVNAMDSNPKRRLALELLDTCKKNNIPTIFYSKEDPPNYEVFLEYAKHCDHICTTAKECIPYYQNDCERSEIHAISFGINPLAHNPIGFRNADKENIVLFSGSWMIKYPDRCKELAVIFDGILDAGHKLHIIDRNFPGNPKYHFPEKYFPFTSPALPHDLLQKLHKLFDWAVNINSVKASETMFANRAFELQANGVVLLSNFSVGVNNMLPTVQMVQDCSEVAPIMESLSGEKLYERQIAGIRSVMTGHTCFDRLASLLAPTGLQTEQPSRSILVLADELTSSVTSCFEKQTYCNKELALASNVTAAELGKYDMVTWFAGNADYGVFYLEDLSNAFKYTACDYITKDAWLEGDVLHEGMEHDYVTKMGSKYRTLFWREAFDCNFLLNLSGEVDLQNGYSIDHFNYNASTVAADVEHTYLLSVIIPVYNNGAHLYGKGFSSLRRSSMFRDMEILLIDDGSTDVSTLKMIHYLEETYPNVRSYFFTDGGSDAPSQPRCKGVELATAPYLTFLDADTEAVCDGYSKLYALARDTDCDLVLGNSYQCGFTPEVITTCRSLTNVFDCDILTDGIAAALEKAELNASDIQGMVFRRELLKMAPDNDVHAAFSSARTLRLLDVPVFLSYAKNTPISGKRPMPTLEELMGSGKRTVSIPVEYTQDGQRFTFRNKSGKANCTYAWVILLASGAYQKVYSSIYTARPEFTYDFSELSPGTYKVRAFQKSQDDKNSNDVAVIRVDEQGIVSLLTNESSASIAK